MNKAKSFWFIVVATLVHQFCYGLLIARYMSCNGRPGCIGSVTEAIEYVLGFPLNLFSWMWHKPGQPVSELLLVLMWLNAVLAAILLYVVVNFLFFKRATRTAK